MKHTFNYNITIYTKHPVTIDIPDEEWNELLEECDNVEGAALFMYVATNINSRILEEEYDTKLDWYEDIEIEESQSYFKPDESKMNVDKTALPIYIDKK